MSEARVRIVLVEPPEAAGAEPLGTAAALGRLGAQAEVAVLHEPVEPERLAAAGLDLVVVDLRLGAAVEGLLAGLRDSGLPVVAVSDDPREAASLRAFRAGASDCVAAGPELAAALPMAALEQIRRGRELRRRRAEHRLVRRVEELERTNQDIVRNLNSALVVVDAEGRITVANPTAERLLDVEPGGLDGASVWRFFPEGALEELPLARTLGEGLHYRGAEGVLRRADGSSLPIGISCAPLGGQDGAGDNGDGGARGAVAIIQDLSEIKQLQRQVLQTEKMASIGQLAAGIAHEINNPMGFVHANLSQMAEYLEDLSRLWERSEALRKAARAGEPTGVAEALEGIDRVVADVDADFLMSDFGKAIRESMEGAERIRHIVQDLRAFSHQDSDQNVEADLNQCLDSTANICWTMMKHSVVLTKDYRELPAVQCRPMQLKQVFMNLMMNGYQAIEARGEEARGEIRLGTEPWKGGVRIRVEDNGTGIPPDHLDRIFDPFFTTKEVGVGMGLGLSTCFNIVRRHGGSLHAESELGRGSAFEVWLPLDGRAREQEPSPA